MVADSGAPPGAVDVILPCLEEAAALPWVLSRLPAGYRAIVADNGSTDGSAHLARELGATVVEAAARRRCAVRIRDLGPMRVARRADLLGLGVTDRRFGYPLELVARAAAAGWNIVETDVRYLPRSGKSKVTGTATGTVRAVRDMSAILRRLP